MVMDKTVVDNRQAPNKRIRCGQERAAGDRGYFLIVLYSVYLYKVVVCLDLSRVDSGEICLKGATHAAQILSVCMGNF
jgi:hypothetical protein